MNEDPKDWKIKLRYGKLTTSFEHFAVFADGIVRQLVDGYYCRPGRAWMAMKAWATDIDESMDMIRVIGNQIGFSVDGKIEVYTAEPEEPPRDKPHGYHIRFMPYDENA